MNTVTPLSVPIAILHPEPGWGPRASDPVGAARCGPESLLARGNLHPVDDGQLDDALLSRFGTASAAKGWRCRYFNMSDRGASLQSRVEAISGTDTDVVVFIDDDVEVEPPGVGSAPGLFIQHGDATIVTAESIGQSLLDQSAGHHRARRRRQADAG